ncbi:hypothetical protein AGABI2DRAFT_117430 [Agaricus bisporus var. bisporus H97]|uniref:hypothetical protein n=1 Tax=Agaricus bisporus var. bisporus (strain H97 / ATCC MYA-4626 / FGSC 10389) TaxID=936046 RepID=UPI00029F573C|nr:hypothetical protein AGABI2DRAFT_117430 [Agaricus bisporus var. bisporus H97]EKV48622.1 hypothetical protein AGABI2DRAFT_117430 [Agaricus bisporus var. bisporus H97]
MDDLDTKSKLACKLAGTNYLPASDSGNDTSGFLTELKKLQSQINTIQSQYRRRFNVIRSSTAALPNEILIIIFRLVCSTVEPKNAGPIGCPQIILGSVSSHWRDIVVDMPEFWETFSVKISQENLQTTIPLLKVYSARRRQMPSSMQLDLRGLDYNSPKVLESLTFLEGSIFSGDTPKLLHSMDVHCPPPYWLSTIVSQCSNLHELSLSWTPQNTGTYIWSRRLPTSIPFYSLRILRINRVPIMLCFDLLLSCPNLTEFTCTTPLVHSRNDPDGWMMMNRDQEVTFPRLERLTWTPTRKYWDKYFLEFFRFPSLRYFAWPIWPGQDSKNLFDSFVAALPPSLESFEIIASPLIAWHRIESILRQIPRITQLIFTDVPSSAHSRLLQMLQYPTFLPSLKACKWIQKVEGEVDHDPQWISHLHGMLQQRKIYGTKEFRYEMVNVETCWRAEDREMISRLKCDGRFKVEIVCNNSILDH